MEEREREDIEKLPVSVSADADADTELTATPDEDAETADGDGHNDKRKQRERERERKARRAFKRLTDLDEEGEADMSLRAILGGDILGGRWFRKQLRYVALLVVLSIIYVSNRYAFQHEEIRREDLADTLIDRKYKVLTISSQLTEFSMRSNIEENLTDTTLKTSTESSYYLNN